MLKSLATKFVFLISILLIIVCGSLGFISNHFSSQAVLKEVNQSLEIVSRETALGLKNDVERQLGLLELLANLEAIKDPEVPAEEKVRVLKSEIQRAGYIDLGIADLEGNLINGQGVAGVNIADQDYFKEAIAGKAVASDPKTSKVDDSVITAYAVPVKHGSQIIGALIATRDGYELSRFTQSIELGGSRAVFVINGQGTAIANADLEKVKTMDNIFKNAEKDPGLADFAALQKKMVAGESGVGSYTYGGIKKYTGYAPVEGTTWSLAVTAPQKEVMAGVDNLRKILISCSFAFFLIGIIAAYGFTRNIVAPLNQLVAKIQEVAKGNLAVEDVEVKSRDEVGLVGDALNIMLGSLRGLVNTAGDLAEQVAASSQELTTGAEQQAKAASEVASTITNLALGAENQEKSVDEITASVEESSATIEQLAVNSNRVAQQTKEAATASSQGQKSALRAVEQMKNIGEVSMKVQSAVGRLAVSSQEISEINDVISGIAEQTNLLALNAAIEAARAGEQGRGFAVVAEEVRKLAEQSQAAAKQIAQRITLNQSHITDAVTAIELSSEDIQAGIEVVNTAGGAFEDIDTLMSMVSSQVAEISTAIQQLAQGSQSIVQAVRSLESITKENMDTSQTVSAATEEQTASIEEIAASSQNLAAMAESLQVSLSKFTV
ncbi:methyl-accepting chemotaxis protein [Desulfitobacterium hafniense]|uniref:methyl-accepting chemotaxis protein n=1 Tax=Desulfitobacterium hafniense TaxID=49338 RepID=UPI00037C6E72|nr:methyl-accepting chemotaxis protein [Desulfitobacterium hafniense]